MNTRPHGEEWRDGCQHCDSGWFYVETKVPAPLPRPFTDDEWNRLGRIPRDELLAKYGSREDAMLEGRESRKSFVVRCMCRAGQSKDSKIPNVAQTLTAEEIREFWPGGLPSSVHGLTDSELQKMGIPLACLHWTLATFEKKFKRDDDAQRYLKLAREWERGGGRRSDVVMFGPNGTGKTGLAIAMLHGMLEQQLSGRFISARELMLQIRDTYKPNAQKSELDVVNEFIAPHVLVLDELSGTNASDATADTITMIVDKRQKATRPTIITVNLGQELGPEEATRELAAFVGPTLFDRLRERSSFWALFGKSKRPTNRKLVDLEDYKRGKTDAED